MIARSLWLRVEHRISIELLTLSKVHLAAVLPRHCPIGVHAVRPKILSDASCQNWMKEGKLETFRQFHRHCLAFARLRLKHLGSLTFGEPENKTETCISRFNKFLKGNTLTAVAVFAYQRGICCVAALVGGDNM